MVARDERHVVIRLGDGHGGFGTEHRHRAGERVLGVALARLDHDRRVDLVAADYEGGGISVFRGIGHAKFGRRARYGGANHPDTVLVADFDGDGNADLAISSVEGDASVRSGRGDGTFGAPEYLPWPLAIGGTVADFNGDGRPDLAFGHGENGTLVKVFLNWTGLPAAPCVVQPLVGRSLREAKLYIGFGGCSLGSVSVEPADDFEANLVISQLPEPGAVLSPNSAVDVVVGD